LKRATHLSRLPHSDHLTVGLQLDLALDDVDDAVILGEAVDNLKKMSQEG